MNKLKDFLANNFDKKTVLTSFGLTLVALVVAFLIFEFSSVPFARRIDIQLGYYSILLTFILLLVGVGLNIPFISKNLKGFLPSGKSICVLAVVTLIFSVFMFNNIGNTHRVLSDETSWESMGLQMYFQHTGGICNEGEWLDGKLNCVTEVNNFKGKALGFVYSLLFNVAKPNRDTALLVNYPFYVFSLFFFFLALAQWFKRKKWVDVPTSPVGGKLTTEKKLQMVPNEGAALAAAVFLGGMPIYLLQARSASTEVLYIFLLSALMAWYAFVPANKVTWKHFLLTVPLLGFFAQTRQETVFAFIPFALYYHKYFLEKFYRLPAFVAAVVFVSWPSVNTMAAYRGYDFQGGEHAAHSLDNFIFNMKTNLEVMMNLDKDPAFGGIMQNPFYTSFTVILLIATVWLLIRTIVWRKYWRGLVLGLAFCIQIFVILLNVSGTFTIDINQRYVLVALPLFALIMALGLYDALQFATKMRVDAAGNIVAVVACLLSLGLMVYHGDSFRNNMLYYRNKLLAEEDYLDRALENYPENSIFIYARPWQMLASGHSSYSERTFIGWDLETFAQKMRTSGGNIYVVRGQDGYGELNRKSRVVGFKTTDQMDEILKDYKHERVLWEPRLFGYPLAMYKINAKRGVSDYQQKFYVSDMENNAFVVNKNFPEGLSCTYSLNGELQEDLHLTLDVDTLNLDSTKIVKGMNRTNIDCLMPDSDTLHVIKDFFVNGEGVLLLSELKMSGFTQDWGEPQVNTTVEHRRLTLNGTAYRYGIGSHANSSLVYRLPSPFKTFHGTIGLDDESVCGDGASFIVAGDGRELFRSKRMYSMDVQNIDVDISGVNVLELRIDMGGDKDCDHGDWANIWLEAR